MVSVSLPSALKETRQDAHDAQQRLEPVKRISIFDQWSAPDKPAQEDFETSNPSYAYVKPYVTVGHKFDATVNEQMALTCSSKCKARSGYNPSADVVTSCMHFCKRLYDDNDAVVVSPQPKTRGWWRRKADSFVPGGRYVHYVANPFGGGAPTMNGQSIPDPYHATPLGASEGTAWISTVEGRAGVDPKQSFVRLPVRSAPPTPPQSHVPAPQMARMPDALDQDGPPLLMSMNKAQPAALKVQHAEQLLMTDLVTPEGLQAINFGQHTALRDIDDYFDTLPTKDCNKPTCSYVDVHKQQTKKLVKKGHKFTTKDIERYEQSVLGYHRRHEHALTAAEMTKIGRESEKLVSKSVVGYEQLEKYANTKGAEVSSDAAFRSQRHSAAYEQATKAKGFAGYYQNVFADSTHMSSHPHQMRGLAGDMRRAAMRQDSPASGQSKEEAATAKNLLDHDTYQAQLHLQTQERRFKQLVGAKLKEEQAAVALAAHTINELKADNQALETKDSALATEAVQQRSEAAAAAAAAAALHQHTLHARDIAGSATRGAVAAGKTTRAVGVAKTSARTPKQAKVLGRHSHVSLTHVPVQHVPLDALNPSGIRRSEKQLTSQMHALEQFEHMAAEKSHTARAHIY